MAGTAWTKERTAQLKKLWAEGLSGGQIEREMSPHGPTRNAIIGKAHRMGLSGRTTQPSARERTRRASRPPRPKPKPVVPRLKAEEIKPLEAGSLTIMNVKKLQCRWPVDRPGMEGIQFCGQPQDGLNRDGVSSSYCADHRTLGTNPSTKTARSAKWKRT
jgi:GcrA cell cycle regulator